MQDIIKNCLKTLSCNIDARYYERMCLHTTFKVGGPADCYIKPSDDNFPLFCADIINKARTAGIPVFILGGGANIVVSDSGIRGIVLDTTAWKGQCNDNQPVVNRLVFRSGTTMDEACEYAAEAGLTGLEFLAGMPGTIGGAVWMNARCYGKEISDCLSSVKIFNFNSSAFSEYSIEDKKGFDYKKSPFQEMDCLILSAAFDLKPGNKEQIICEMDKNRRDRKEKGHYLFPCAGSAFKNNSDFGKPTGQIIDELGLRGMTMGGAQIAPFHGNIVINKDNAAAADIKALMDKTAAIVKEKTGFELEPEIIFAGKFAI
ncbi:MAG: UDP-N-acetylmuramate dehydrogenase [Treponema sp.]|nr:UDP-N-acetylmuramate dehydrogenase [Treponema sp.]